MRALLGLLVSALLCAGALQLEAQLARGKSAQRAATLRIERLVAPDELPDKPIAGISIETANGGDALYLRSKGVWRALHAFGAPARADRIAQLVSDFHEGSGVLRNVAPERLDAYGLGPTQRARIRFHGPQVMKAEDRDTLTEFWISTQTQASGRPRSFVQRAGEPAVFELDRDPSGLFAFDPQRGFIALDDRRIVGCAWPNGVTGLERVFIDHADGTSLELRAETGASDAPPTWSVLSGDERHDASTERVVQFFAHLVRTPYEALIDPRQAEELGLAQGASRLTIVPRGERAVECVVGALRARAQGRGQAALVLNNTLQLLGVVDETSRARLLPGPEQLTGSAPSPWE